MASNRIQNAKISFFNAVIVKKTKKRDVGMIHQASMNERFRTRLFYRVKFCGFQCQALSMSESYFLEYSFER